MWEEIAKQALRLHSALKYLEDYNIILIYFLLYIYHKSCISNFLFFELIG